MTRGISDSTFVIAFQVLLLEAAVVTTSLSAPEILYDLRVLLMSRWMPFVVSLRFDVLVAESLKKERKSERERRNRR